MALVGVGGVDLRVWIGVRLLGRGVVALNVFGVDRYSIYFFI